MQLSFIVPAHNEQAHIGACLAAIHQACQPLGYSYEILVAADACTDLTATLAQQGGARVIPVEHRHIAATRNSGAAASQGQWLFFVDADTQVSPAAVAAACRNLLKGNAGGGGLFRFDKPVPFYGLVVERAAWIFCLLTHMSGGCFLHCQRHIFEKIGGFDSRLYAGEELAFAHAVKAHGRFRVVPHTVLTSARKVRLYSGRELLRMVFTILRKGPRALMDRTDLGLWYQRREEKQQSQSLPTGSTFGGGGGS
ncbi:glycosyltransferase [bacterium]|nr:glycosyltransferase [bacterium]